MENIRKFIEENRHKAVNARSAEELKKRSVEEKIKELCSIYNQTDGNLHEADGYSCDKCRNRGYIAEARFDRYWYEIHVECDCMAIRRTIYRLRRAGLSEVMRECTFDRYEVTSSWQATIKKAAESYVNAENAWLFIGGQSGAGKTHLCTAAAVQIVKQGKELRYMKWLDDAARIKALASEAGEYEKEVNIYKTAAVLYIDDLFKTGNDQPPTAADIRLAFEILNYRYNNKALKTIISSERTITQLNNIDVALCGRIIEMAVKPGYGFSLKPDKQKNYRAKWLGEI